MTPERMRLASGVAERATILLILMICLATWGLAIHRPLIPDIAWLIEGTRRWLNGAVLYRDIIEVNPPLIFYENVLLTATVLTGPAYLAGVCIAIAITSLWCLRLRGAYAALGALVACTLGGLTDFGQRGHLALIFVIPLLLGEHASRRERIMLGIWAFLGIGLKPYLVPIPIAAAACRAFNAKSLRPLFRAEYVTLGTACGAYVLFVAIAHPTYFSRIVPLARFVYFAYGNSFRPIMVLVSFNLALIAAARPKEPLAWSTVAALVSFYWQGRFWTYHFVPAVGLGLLLAILEARKSRLALALVILLTALQTQRISSATFLPNPVPPGVKSVAFLSTHVWAAYPAVLKRGIHNDTRYPALWTLPGAWNIATNLHENPKRRRRAMEILARQRAIIRGDIIRQHPQLIYADDNWRAGYFDRPFDFIAFLGPFPRYHADGTAKILGHFKPYRVLAAN